MLAVVLWLIRTRRLHERHAMLWILGTTVIVFLGAFPSVLKAVATSLGFTNAPTALLILIVGFLGLVILDCILTISKLTDRTRVLAQRLAMLEERLNRVQGDDHGAAVAPRGADEDA